MPDAAVRVARAGAKVSRRSGRHAVMQRISVGERTPLSFCRFETRLETISELVSTARAKPGGLLAEHRPAITREWRRDERRVPLRVEQQEHNPSSSSSPQTSNSNGN